MEKFNTKVKDLIEIEKANYTKFNNHVQQRIDAAVKTKMSQDVYIELDEAHKKASKENQHIEMV